MSFDTPLERGTQRAGNGSETPSKRRRAAGESSPCANMLPAFGNGDGGRQHRTNIYRACPFQFQFVRRFTPYGIAATNPASRVRYWPKADMGHGPHQCLVGVSSRCRGSTQRTTLSHNFSIFEPM